MGRAQRKRAAPQAQAAPPPKASAAKRKKAQKLRQKADALEKRAALYAALADNGASGDDLRVVRAAVAGARAGGTARQRATAALLKERRGLARLRPGVAGAGSLAYVAVGTGTCVMYYALLAAGVSSS